MNYRIEGALKKGKTTIIVAIILWFLLAIVFIMPWTMGLYYAEKTGEGISGIITGFGSAVYGLKGWKYIFQYGQFFNYLKNLLGFSLLYILVVAIGLWRLMPKHRYDDIEHGSSDWSEHGEQYQVLSKKEGIILAENNYLPLDKRGNVNVLIVRRFWCW